MFKTTIILGLLLTANLGWGREAQVQKTLSIPAEENKFSEIYRPSRKKGGTRYDFTFSPQKLLHEVIISTNRKVQIHRALAYNSQGDLVSHLLESPQVISRLVLEVEGRNNNDVYFHLHLDVSEADSFTPAPIPTPVLVEEFLLRDGG